MKSKVILCLIILQTAVIFSLATFTVNLKDSTSLAFESLKQNNCELVITSLNEVNERLKFVEDGIPDITKRNMKAKIIKDLVRENIRELKINNFKSEKELNEYSFSVLDSSEKYKLPVSLILAVSRAESNFNVRAVSEAKAKGIMQMVDSTFQFCTTNLNKENMDVFYVADSVTCGSWYLKYLSKMFNGNIDLVIKSYNAGPTFIQKFNGENLPAETIDYHKNVSAFIEIYKSKLYWENK